MLERVSRSYEVLVVGAGPAGLAAATSAAGAGASVGIIDDNPAVGGQIWRGETAGSRNCEAARLIRALGSPGIETLCGAGAIHHDLKSRKLFVETADGLVAVQFSKLILATGARERLLPFPGWTLPNVMAAGGLQAMVKSGLPIAGKRVLVAGSGPLLLAVAAYLGKHGANLLAICEQAGWSALTRFGLSLFGSLPKIREGLVLARALRGVPFWPGSWPVRAIGSEKLEAVIVSRNGKPRELACDYLACGFHLVPNTEPAALIGCELRDGFVKVDEYQQTSVENVFCAGEPTGIGGLEVSLIEGQTAGLAAAGQGNRTAGLRRRRENWQTFVRALEKAFQLRRELKSLPDDSTIVCRCEDVPYARSARYASWRDAKNQSRCGMGPCQGRICGPATQFLFEWCPESVRPPLFPARVESLAAIAGAPGE